MPDRPLSFLSAEALDAALSLALRCAARRGRWVYFPHGAACWDGPGQPACVWQLLDEYRERYRGRGRPHRSPRFFTNPME